MGELVWKMSILPLYLSFSMSLSTHSLTNTLAHLGELNQLLPMVGELVWKGQLSLYESEDYFAWVKQYHKVELPTVRSL